MSWLLVLSGANGGGPLYNHLAPDQIFNIHLTHTHLNKLYIENAIHYVSSVDWDQFHKNYVDYL